MITFSAKLDEKELRRYLGKLDKVRGKPLATRAERVTAAAARLMVPVGRREAPIGEGRIIRGELVRPGNLRRRIKTRQVRKRGTEAIRPVWFGSTAYYGPMVSRGTRSHSLAPTHSGKSTLAAFSVDEIRPLDSFPNISARADPWVDRVWAQMEDDIYALIERDVFDTRD